MERVKLVVHQRDDTGTRNAKRLRKKGLIPGVLYGSGNPAAASRSRRPCCAPR